MHPSLLPKFLQLQVVGMSKTSREDADVNMRVGLHSSIV